MKDLELGKILKEEQQRDAIHVAIAPVIATERLVPGDHIGFVDDTHTEVTTHTSNKLGIVDPFLTTKVMPGERFWMFLYPQTITSLRHDWTHPAFEVVAPAIDKEQLSKAASENWLRAFATGVGISYETLMGAWEQLLDQEGAGYFPSTGLYDVELSDEQEAALRQHYETVTGKKVSADISPFRCSC